MREFAGAVLHFPATYEATLVTVYAGIPADDTALEGSKEPASFQALTDSGGNAITLTVGQDKAVLLPASCFPCQWIKLVTNNTASNARDVSIALKG